MAAAAAAAAAANEEEIMKMRLLIDGDGTGEDRKLNLLLKQIMKWLHTDDTPDEATDTYHKLVTYIAQTEWNMSKAQLVSAMNAAEFSNYEALVDKIESGISETRVQIDATKQDLKDAKKVRRNRLEYDSLAKVICENPDRLTTGRQLEELRTELEELRTSEVALDEKFQERKLQFHVLLRSIHQLQSLLDSDEAALAAANASSADNGADGDADTDGEEGNGAGAMKPPRVSAGLRGITPAPKEEPEERKMDVS